MKKSPLYLSLLCLFSVVVAGTCGACAGHMMNPEHLRDPEAQFQGSVLVTAACFGDEPTWYGSGVIVSKDRVLTDEHVVKCPLGLTPKVWVNPGDGNLEAEVEVEIVKSDIARLKMVTADLSGWFVPLSLGPPPPIGETVCWSALSPRPTYRCGTSNGLNQGMIMVDGMVEHGNSGSGAYDEKGRLVGLVRATTMCQNKTFCVGWITPLKDFQWLIP